MTELQKIDVQIEALKQMQLAYLNREPDRSMTATIDDLLADREHQRKKLVASAGGEPKPVAPPCDEKCVERAVLIDENFALKQQLGEAHDRIAKLESERAEMLTMFRSICGWCAVQHNIPPFAYELLDRFRRIEGGQP